MKKMFSFLGMFLALSTSAWAQNAMPVNASSADAAKVVKTAEYSGIVMLSGKVQSSSKEELTITDNKGNIIVLSMTPATKIIDASMVMTTIDKVTAGDMVKVTFTKAKEKNEALTVSLVKS